MSEAPVELRVGDRERREVDAQLQAAVGDGVLTLAEYDERAGLLWRARTRRELDALVADLPGAVPPSPPVRWDGSTRRVVAVMSEDRFAGAVAPGQPVDGWAVMGSAKLDLRREDLPDGTRVSARAVMGDVEVLVPPGTRVELSGASVMGERKVEVAAGSGPTVFVSAVAVMGSVKVGVGDGSVVATGGAVARRAPVPAQREQLPRRPRRGLRAALAGLTGTAVAGALVLGGAGWVVAQGDDASTLFGSTQRTVDPADDVFEVSVLFGSVQVVVPEDVRVDVEGTVVFGSTECGEVCRRTDGTPVTVRVVGGFGSVEVVTASEAGRD